MDSATLQKVGSACVFGGGMFILGYMLSKRRSLSFGRGHQNKVGKSYSGNADNKVLQYCIAHTTPDHPVQQELLKETLASYKEARMLGAPECLALNAAIIRSKNAKKILDIGVFTGASALASALAFSNKSDPECQVIACDVTDKYEEFARRFWDKAGVEDKIQLRIAPGMNFIYGYCFIY